MLRFHLIGMLLISGTILFAADAPRDLGSRRELFVDRFLIESMHGVSLRLHEPRDEGEVLRFDKPWEGVFCAYSTILKDGDKYRLYYRGKAGGADGRGEVTCY